jgi:uncharacterized peroxidase-related enzyme
MARLKTIGNEATGKAKELLDGVHAKLGMTPNLMRILANSPAALEAYLSFNEALSKGLLHAKLRELISVAVADQNSCTYCLSAHTAIGKMVGLKEEEIIAGRSQKSADAKTEAALRFVHAVVERRGQLNQSDVETLRSAGYGDGEIAEIVANVGLNILTNYFNNVVATEVDFPQIDLKKSA